MSQGMRSDRRGGVRLEEFDGSANLMKTVPVARWALTDDAEIWVCEFEGMVDGICE